MTRVIIGMALSLVFLGSGFTLGYMAHQQQTEVLQNVWKIGGLWNSTNR